MSEFFLENQSLIYIVILSILLGIEVMSNVPAILHTPLMSGANAIHGVVIIGAIIVMGHAASDDYLALTLGFLAVSVSIAFGAWWFTGDPIRAVAVLVVATPCPLILAVPGGRQATGASGSSSLGAGASAVKWREM